MLYLCKHNAHRISLELRVDIVNNHFKQLWSVIIVTGTSNIYRSKFLKAWKMPKHFLLTAEKLASCCNNFFAKYATGSFCPTSFSRTNTVPTQNWEQSTCKMKVTFNFGGCKTVIECSKLSTVHFKFLWLVLLSHFCKRESSLAGNLNVSTAIASDPRNAKTNFFEVQTGKCSMALTMSGLEAILPFSTTYPKHFVSSLTNCVLDALAVNLPISTYIRHNGCDWDVASHESLVMMMSSWCVFANAPAFYSTFFIKYWKVFLLFFNLCGMTIHWNRPLLILKLVNILLSSLMATCQKADARSIINTYFAFAAFLINSVKSAIP